MNITDIRSDGTLRVVGKGNKERIIYLNEACREALTATAHKPVDGVGKKTETRCFTAILINASAFRACTIS